MIRQASDISSVRSIAAGGIRPRACSCIRRRRTGRLAIRTDARASAVLFDGKRAIGVRYVDDRDRSDAARVHARREVILSCGTANTAKLLQISGVGPAALLGSIGVPVVHELRGVGENFRDHYSARLVARVKNSTTINEMSRGIGSGRADRALGDGQAEHSRAEPVAGALVLEIG